MIVVILITCKILKILKKEYNNNLNWFSVITKIAKLTKVQFLISR